MTFRKYNLYIILQIVLITANSLIIAWTTFHDHLKVSTVYFFIILLLQMIFLFYFITKQNKEIIRFLESLKYGEEFSKLSEKNVAKSHRDLRRLLNQIAESYSQVKVEKENEHFYFLNTIKHVNVGLISFEKSGKIELMNDAFKKLLKIDHIKNVRELKPVFSNANFNLEDIPVGKPQLIKLPRENEILQLSVNATTFIIKDHQVTLVSMQDIRNEIQKEEIEIWQKLIRVLTHEIMNSAGPITSLSATLTDTFKDDIKPHKIGEKLYNQIVIGLQAIQKRSRGLARFVETYRNLTKLPNPSFNEIKVEEFLKHLQILVQNELDQENISLYVNINPPNLRFTIDEKMFTQVFLNLIKNSIHALKGLDNKSIWINIAELSNKNLDIKIEDNGIGISNEVLERVFVPFFSTKEEGSGIGLSLSRQIISLHGGTLNIRSEVGIGTSLEIIL